MEGEKREQRTGVEGSGEKLEKDDCAAKDAYNAPER